MQKTLTKSLILTAILTTALGASYLFAAWTGPNQAPPGGNTETPIHIGSTNQVKDGGLSLDGLSVFGGGYFQGNVGIGTVSPQATLDVAGKIKVSNDASAPQAGNIRFTGTDFEGYDGTEWKSLTASSVTTEAGLPFYGTAHTKQDCRDAGGTVTDYQNNSFCKFSASSCPSGWTRYQNLGSTSSNSCTGSDWNDCQGTTCSTGNHFFIDKSVENCKYYHAGYDWEFNRCENGPSEYCSAILIEVGCY